VGASPRAVWANASDDGRLRIILYGDIGPRPPVADDDNPSGTPGAQGSRGPVLLQTANLTISKQYLGPLAEPGKDIAFAVNYNNLGPDPATTTIITDLLPAGTIYISDTSGLSMISTTLGTQQLLTYTVGTLPSGNGGLFDIYIRVLPTTSIGSFITNSTGIQAAESDPDTTNNTSAVGILVLGGEMVVTKDAPPYALPGAPLTYTIRYTNTGNETAANVVVTDLLPISVTFGSAIPAPSASSGNLYTWTIGSMGSTTTGTIQLIVTPFPTLTFGSALTNVVGITTTTAENSTANNLFTTTTLITGTVDLQVSKSDGGLSVNAGDLITYTIYFTNNGTGSAYNVVLTETVPANSTYASGPVWTFVGGNVYTYSIPVIPPTAPQKYGQVQFIVRANSSMPSGVKASPTQ
jgi:uncharacterized repeat protein (TIGR01451 family)